MRWASRHVAGRAALAVDGHEHLQPLLARLRLQQLQGIGCQLGHRQGRELKRHLACFQRGQVDEVVEHAREARGRVHHVVQDGLEAFVLRAVAHQLGHAQDQGHGRARLVPDVRQKVPLGMSCITLASR